MKRDQQSEVDKDAKKKNLKQMNIRITSNLYKRLQYCCMATNLSPSNLISTGLEQLFASLENKGFEFPKDMVSKNLKILSEMTQSANIGEKVDQKEIESQNKQDDEEEGEENTKFSTQARGKNSTNAQSHNRNKSSDGENMFSSEQKNFTLN